MSLRSVVIGCGSYLPKKIVTNKELEKIVETNDQWIVERTGIKQRHIVADDESTSHMAAKAALEAIKGSGIETSEIDLIIVATTTPDNVFPSVAAQVQAIIGASKTAAFDVQAVCAGFVYGLSIADKFIKSGEYKNILVIGAEAITRLVDWNDRTTCILFGDGAGALLLQAQQDSGRGILSCNIFTDGTLKDILYVDGGPGSLKSSGKIKMTGKEVFKHAVNKLVDCTQKSLESAKLTGKDIDWVVPHQANLRILEAVIKRLEIPETKLISTVADHANTSAASIPLAIDSAVKSGKIKKGNTISLQAIGGGMSWGACVLKW